jgi:fibro-slime domain-containing protein
MVEEFLDSEKKPVFRSLGNPVNLTSKERFDEWYRDVPNVNMAFQVELPLTQMGTRYVYDNSAFFPLNDQGFGNEGLERNFHFTTEIHTTVTYLGGEVFVFRGDDDVWIFVNKKLALDLGGLHPRLSGEISFDSLNLTKGQKYQFDVFHAERRTNASNFRMETNIDCFEPPMIN